MLPAVPRCSWVEMKPGCLLHERGVVSPQFRELLGITGRQVELVDQHHWAVILLQLLHVGDLVVYLT